MRMAIHDLAPFRHDHDFDAGNRAGEHRTWWVVAITALTMAVEIGVGLFTGSMALLADGWHMATHVIALSIAGAAYLLARRWSSDSRFAFGTWKIEVLGAFSSALLLAVVAIAMVFESVRLLISPVPIRFGIALDVAVIGLVVNLVSAWILGTAHHEEGHTAAHQHEHEHEHDHDHDHDHGDMNLRSAYVHVLADAFTSVLAIGALGAGLLYGWTWPDAASGIVGGVVIAWWSKGLLAQSARVLLDREMDAELVAQIHRAIECDGDAEVADLHVWRVGRARRAAVLCVVADDPLLPAAYRERLASVPGLSHVSVEVNRCVQGRCCRERAA